MGPSRYVRLCLACGVMEMPPPRKRPVRTAPQDQCPLQLAASGHSSERFRRLCIGTERRFPNPPTSDTGTNDTVFEGFNRVARASFVRREFTAKERRADVPHPKRCHLRCTKFRSCPCLQIAGSNLVETSGTSCARNGSQTASSSPATISSPLLRCLAKARKRALAHHVHRAQETGSNDRKRIICLD